MKRMVRLTPKEQLCEASDQATPEEQLCEADGPTNSRQATGWDGDVEACDLGQHICGPRSANPLAQAR